MKLFAIAALAVAAALPAQSKQERGKAGQDGKAEPDPGDRDRTTATTRGFAPSEAAYLKSVKPQSYASLEYSHKSLASQLDGGVRQLEIDVFPDPKGGRFAHPSIIQLTKDKGLPEDPYFDPKHEMEKPGIKVIHVQDLNQRSSCPLFTECLQQVREWSKAHPDHVPLFLLIENKSGKSNMPGGVTFRCGRRPSSMRWTRKSALSSPTRR